MLSDDEVALIRRGLKDGLRGPITIKWLHELLAERDELVALLSGSAIMERHGPHTSTAATRHPSGDRPADALPERSEKARP